MDNLLSEKENKLFENLSKSSSRVYFFYTDFRDGIAHWSESAVEYFGLPGTELTDMTLWDQRVHPDDLAEYQRSFVDMVSGKTPYHNCEYRIRNVKGEYVWVNCRGYMTLHEDGTPDFFAGFVMNMGTVNKIDPLTGLWTNYGFRNDLIQMLEMGYSGAAMQIDVGNFKQINATYGYSYGDRVLYALGQKLLGLCDGNRVQSKVSVYRVDGAQFAIRMRGGREQLESFKEKAVELMEQIVVDGHTLHLDFYIGATVFPDDGAFVDQIQNNLSYALSHAKTIKSTEIVFYSKEIYEQRAIHVRLSHALRESIQKDFEGFRIVLQPVVDAQTGELHSAEALLRWSHEEFPKVGPMDFVPILEETRGILSVGRWIIDQALSTVAQWREKKENRSLPHVNVNFSYIQLMDRSLKDYVIAKLDEYRLPYETLVLEMTESCRIEYRDELAEILDAYHDAGVKIALDDFGTGYASLAVLKDIPADIVKLDYSMVSTIANRPKDRSLVEFIINYCDQMGINVCTEGVENDVTLSIVREAGASYIQGYYYDRPLELDAFYEKYICPVYRK